MKKISYFSILLIISLLNIYRVNSACASGERDDGFGNCNPCSFYSEVWDGSNCVPCSSGTMFNSGDSLCHPCVFFNRKDYGSGVCEECISQMEVIDTDGTCQPDCTPSGYDADPLDNFCKTW